MQRTGGWIKHWLQDLIGAGLAIAVGLIALAAHPVSLRIEEWSYDFSYGLRPKAQTEGVVLVSMDAISRKNLEQPDPLNWDRQLHATLLDRLMARGAKMVVFTTVFSEPTTNTAADRLFAQALRRARGKVALAAELTEGGTRPPIPELAAAAPWGLLATPTGTDNVIRRHGAPGGQPTLAARVAAMLGKPASNALASRWLNYRYSTTAAWPELRYEDVLKGSEPPGTLKGKIVLIGPAADDSAGWPVPFTRWTGKRLSRSEIEATAILNLVRGEWLSRLPSVGETSVVVIMGVLFGFAFMGMRIRPALLLAVGGMILLAVGASVLVVYIRLWFPWLIIAGAQIPAALGWAWLCTAMDRVQTPKPRPIPPQPGPKLPGSSIPALTTSTTSTSPVPASPVSPPADSPNIPDHTLIRCIGRGAYGEVWLARDVIGRHHAVKIVKARNFPHTAPYEREFTGIEHFAPISRTHPGLMQVLHVGRHDDAGYFFYIMDLADDTNGNSRLDPERYEARTLASELARRGHFSARDSVEIGLTLSAALEHLHQHKLVHRDIKPSNIIFVAGQARIADIGLVAQLDTGAEPMTRLGTEGYLPPEGPGAPTADVYALGKVLYEISMGRDRWQFPEFPTSLGTRPDQADLRQVHEIILTACETDPAHRYPSAAAMHAALAQLRTTLR